MNHYLTCKIICAEYALSHNTAKLNIKTIQYHEHAHSTGYPHRITAEQIYPLAGLLALINSYDSLCNPQNVLSAKTPYEALAHMFANQRSKFDDSMLKQFIKSLGAYPPDSVVSFLTAYIV